jgi:hypothetical protein
MKANELMIDDLVYLVKDYGRPKKDILKIDVLDLHRISDGMFEVEPIPFIIVDYITNRFNNK